MNLTLTTILHPRNRVRRLPRFHFSLAIAWLTLTAAEGWAQTSLPSQGETITIEGAVHSADGQPVADASVTLNGMIRSFPAVRESRTDSRGKFTFSTHEEGSYTLTVEKAGFRKCVTDRLTLSAGQKKQLDLLLQSSTALQSSSAEPMEFDDKPNFTVAGVTDWSGAGGHGADTSLRTSEAFARETLALKSSGPEGAPHNKPASSAAPEAVEMERKLRSAVAAAHNSFDANHQLGEFCLRSGRVREAISYLKNSFEINPDDFANAFDLAQAYRANGDLVPALDLASQIVPHADRNADLHRLLGDLDERLGDPLNAVREYERAATLDPAEQNYFEWGSELLLHRAVSPAVTVFRKGSLAHPYSSRMLVGLGAALYAGGSYDDAARELCQASDLKPDDPTPYLFLGKMEVTVPSSFPCAEEKLSSFLKIQPENALASYYFAMLLLKRARESKDSTVRQHAQALLEKSVTIDPKLGEAYLQLGTLYAGQGSSDRAIVAYCKAIEATPSLSEVHYRLSQLYKHNGEKAKADHEIQLYKQVEKTEADATEQQRREVQQFLIILKEQPTSSSPQ